MKFYQAVALSLVAFVLGFLLGVWRAAGASQAVPPVNTATPPGVKTPKVVTLEINKMRFSGIRTGTYFLPDESGVMHDFTSVDVAVENTVDPAAPLGGLLPDNAMFVQGAAPWASQVRIRVLDKFSVPEGIYAKVNENATILRFTAQTPPASELANPPSQPDKVPLTLRFSIGPAKTPVELTGLQLP